MDDGSTDRTVELAQLAGAQVISHYENLGKGAALKTGFRAARDADIIVTLVGTFITFTAIILHSFSRMMQRNWGK